VDDLKGRQELYNGFGDTFTRGMEMVLTPLFLGGIGYVLDRLIGLLPVFTIILTLIGVVGVGVKEYYTYKAAMAAHDADAPWAPRKRLP